MMGGKEGVVRSGLLLTPWSEKGVERGGGTLAHFLPSSHRADL